MFGFHLVPVDGGAPVHVPPGDTVLGRGPLLAVSDRRISRHHAVLQNLDGKLRLKPTHLNPCFIQSLLTDDPRPLVKDSWWPLRHGDVFSLLPGQFVYRVAAVGGASNRNGHKEKQKEEELSHLPEPDVEPTRPIRANCGKTPPHEESPGLAEEEEGEPTLNRRLNNQEDKTVREEVKDDDDGGIDRGGASSVLRTRVLPGWMMAVVGTPHVSSPKPKVVLVKTSTASKQATPPAADSPAEAELSEEEEQRPRKKRRKKVRDVSDEEEKTEATPTVAIDPASTTTRASDISEPEDNRKSSVLTPSKRPLRMPCPYGRDCYRKNPVHFQECSHPEDTDYEDEEQGAELDRPECPYGTDCYRKNPLHRKEFRHTRTAARTTRTARKKSPAQDEDEDDSFIDDDSEDAGDDSDYVPPDSEDSGREDVHRLQKEAKMFLQSRK